jgi:tetratricopeptide (TPR) repeat protein
MGHVFRARDPGLDREVAIKLLHADRLAGAQLERFRREARALAQIEHPGVVRLHALDMHQGRPFLVMDLVEGESLAARLERVGTLRPTAAAELTLALAEALEEVHALGILHRDLKPDNVLIDGAGQPRLTDFGLAKASEEGGEGLSKTGQFLGTPGYWPPEQARGERARVGPASDVYGLGGILYACLTGRPPVLASTLVEFLDASWKTPDAPSRLKPGIDAALDGICLRCLEAEPEDRWPSAAALTEALEAYLQGGQVTRARAGSPGLVAALLVVVVGLAGAVAIVGRELLGEGPVAQAPPAVQASPSPRPSPAGTTASEPRAGSAPSAADRAEDELDRGRALYEAGDPERALEAFDVAVSLDPANPIAFSDRGATRQKLGDMVGALEDFDRALTLDPTLTKPWLNRAAIQIAQGALLEARADLERALELDPGSGSVWRDLGIVCHRLKDAEAAVAAFTRAIELEPDDWAALHSRGVVHENAGRAREAADDYQAALEVGAFSQEDELRVIEDLIDVTMTLDDRLGEEAALTRKIALRPSDAAYTARASARLALGRSEEALADLDKALALDPSAFSYRNRAVTRRRLGDYAGAMSDLDQALALDPTDLDVLEARGVVQSDLGDLVAAEREFQRGLELDPSQGRFWRGRGLSRRYLGQLLPALADFEQALRLHTEPAFLFERGELRWMLGDVLGTLEDMEAVIRSQPERAEAWINRGQAHQRLGRYEQALSDFREAEQRGRRGTAQLIARALALAGDRERALAVLRQELESDHADAYTALWLAGLGGDRAPLSRFSDGEEWIQAVARHYQQGGDATALLARARAAESVITRAQQLCEAHCYLGLEAELVGERESALAHYHLAVATGVLEYVEYGWAWRRLLDMAADAKPSHAYAAATDRGEAHAVKGEMEQARRAFDEAIALQPHVALGYLLRALARPAPQELSGAFLDCCRAIELEPDNAIAWSARARIRMQAKDYAGAEGDLARSLQASPRGAWVEDARRMLSECQRRLREQTAREGD